MIQVEDVHKSFVVDDGGTVEALRDVTLHVEPGEFVTVVGRSGCGKSTLLRLIAGLVSPTAGEVRVDDDPVREPRQDVGLMFQRPALLPWRSVLDNVLLPIEVIVGPTRDYRERAVELLETAQLGGFEDRSPQELSGGMQQRVSLCRSLIHDPQVLLMDEPFGALDALTREDLANEFQRICADQGKTVVFVTHSIDEAVLLADRVVVLTPRPGRLRSIVAVPGSRPRQFGRGGRSPEIADCIDRVHDLLFERAEVAP